MSALALRCFLLIAGLALGLPALAGVGGTSAGVTTTLPTQGTDPSADVQAQSAGFVQQNQQLQNAGAAGSGVVLPANASGQAGASAGTATQGNAANSAAGANAKQKPGDPNAPPATPVAPAAPPAPPPTYVSVVKHLAPQTPDTKGANETVAGIPPPVMPATPAPKPEPAAPSPAVTPAPAPVAPPHAAGNRARANAADANSAKSEAADHTTAAPAITGGSGEAPDGFAFYLGLGIALVLLAFAGAAYLRAQRDEAAIRPPQG